MKKTVIFLALLICLVFSQTVLAADFGVYEVELAGNITCLFDEAKVEYGTFTYSFIGGNETYSKDALFITAQFGSIINVFDRYNNEYGMKYGYIYVLNEEKNAYELSDIGSIELFTEQVDYYYHILGINNVLIELGEEEKMGGKTVFLKFAGDIGYQDQITPEGTYFATGGYADFVFEDAVISDMQIPVGYEYFGEYQIVMQDAQLITVNPDSMIFVVVPDGSYEPSNYYGYHYSLNAAGTAYEMTPGMNSTNFTDTVAGYYFDNMGEEGRYIYGLGTGLDGRPVFLTCMGWEIADGKEPLLPSVPDVPATPVTPVTPDAPSVPDTPSETPANTQSIVLTLGSQNALVGGENIAMDVAPEIVSVNGGGVTFVPVRFVTENLGLVNNWNAASPNDVNLSGNGFTGKITIGSTDAVINGASKTLLAAPFAKNGRTMVPLRFLSESLGYTVNYDPATQTISIK